MLNQFQGCDWFLTAIASRSYLNNLNVVIEVFRILFQKLEIAAFHLIFISPSSIHVLFLYTNHDYCDSGASPAMKLFSFEALFCQCCHHLRDDSMTSKCYHIIFAVIATFEQALPDNTLNLIIIAC